jgi:signal transduction histidine kinase
MRTLARLSQGASGARSDVSGGLRAHRDAAVDWLWALLSLGLALAMFAAGGLGPGVEDQRGLDGLGVLIAAGTSLPLLARRRAPIPVFVVVIGFMVALSALKYPPDISLGPWVALFTLAQAAGRELPARLAVGLAAAAFLAVATAWMLAYDEPLFPEMGFSALLWAAIWLGGRSARLKAEQIDSLEERAARAEREAQRERLLAAAEERTRIARDLHDSAAHAINVILMQAGAARLLRERDPDRSEEALRTIEKVAREQIGEIDRLVHALRAKDPEGDAEEHCSVPGDVPTGPAAGRALFERMRAAGLDLEVEWRGERHLGSTVGRTTYRILQEALTNAARHGTGSASVILSFGERSVEITVENPVGIGAGADRLRRGSNGDRAFEGHGLIGMRERAGLLGGSLEAAQSDGVFRVWAELPYDPSFDLPPARELEALS